MSADNRRMSDEIRALRRTGEPRWIVSLAHANAYVPMARNILSHLGYSIVPIDEWLASPELLRHPPELCIVDQQRIDELPADREFEGLSLVVLTGRGGVTNGDPRIIGGIPTPAGLHELYRLLQQALEANPRSCVRIPTQIQAKIRQRDREWTAPLLSLSENGCLVRSTEPLALDTPMEIMFDLPRLGRVNTRAEPTYQLLPDTGLVFERTAPGHRRSIQLFVEKHLSP